jgi:hypothetical protein
MSSVCYYPGLIRCNPNDPFISTRFGGFLQAVWSLYPRLSSNHKTTRDDTWISTGVHAGPETTALCKGNGTCLPTCIQHESSPHASRTSLLARELTCSSSCWTCCTLWPFPSLAENHRLRQNRYSEFPTIQRAYCIVLGMIYSFCLLYALDGRLLFWSHSRRFARLSPKHLHSRNDPKHYATFLVEVLSNVAQETKR